MADQPYYPIDHPRRTALRKIGSRNPGDSVSLEHEEIKELIACYQEGVVDDVSTDAVLDALQFLTTVKADPVAGVWCVGSYAKSSSETPQTVCSCCERVVSVENLMPAGYFITKHKVRV